MNYWMRQPGFASQEWFQNQELLLAVIPNRFAGPSVVAGRPDTFGERAGTRTGNFHEMGIRGDLIQYRQKALGFGEETVVHIGLELHQGVVDSQAVKLGPTLQQD
jgi:hypothetical protein